MSVDVGLVRDAFVFTLPLAEEYRQTALAQRSVSALNRMLTYRDLLDASYRLVPSPNTDTLYTAFGYDLSEGPVVFQAPPIPSDRYFVLPFYDAFTNVYASFGTRMGTTDGVSVLITPPGYQGPIPDGLSELRSPSLIGSMLGRILVTGSDDLSAVHALQDEFVLEPLEGWLAGERRPSLDEKHPEPVPGYTVLDTRGNPDEYWEAVGRMIAGTPVPDPDAAAFDQFAGIGLSRTGFTPPTDETDLRALRNGTREAWQFIADFAADQSAAAQHGVEFFNVNGWGWSTAIRDEANTGSISYGNKYLLRAWVNYLYYGMLPPDEALYPAVYTDADGARLHGNNQYSVTFALQDKPVRPQGFTSITLYADDGYFVDNPDKIYKISDRDTGLAPDAHGNLTITVSPNRPADDRPWLPSPAGRDFYLMYRTYLPDARVLNGSYPFPAVQRLA